MEEHQNSIQKLGTREAIYEDIFKNSDLVKFTTGLRDVILQQAPPHRYGMLVAILNPLVDLKAVIQQTTELVLTSEKPSI